MSCFQTYAARWGDPHATAIDAPEGSISWFELGERVARAAGFLRERGVRRGDVVAVQFTRALAPFELHLGALALGVATVPLNDKYTPEEVAYIVADSGAQVVALADPSAVPGAVGLEALRRTLDTSTAAPIAEGVPSDTLAAIPYTSGTTGRPKGAMVTHAALLALVHSLHEAWRWTPDDVLLHALPLFHIHGLFVAQHGALYAGARTEWLPRFEAEVALQRLAAGGATMFMGVPTFYQRFLDTPGEFNLQRVRLFTSGSAALPEHVHTAFARRFGHHILERYGLTEAGIVLSNPYAGERRPGAVGFPLPTVEARIVDVHGAEAAPGEIGELELKGPTLFSGYWRQSEKSTAAFRDGWLRTGDLARKDPEGYYHIVGRSKDLVISGGFNIYPSEVESAITDHPDVVEAAVIGVPDADLGERPVATVVIRDGASCSSTDLGRWVQTRLAPYKRPRAWAETAALPRNTMGKVLKTQIAADWRVPRVRLARPEDIDAVVRANRAMAEETEGLRLDAEASRRGATAILENAVDATYWIAEVGGGYAGQCMVTREWSDWRGTYVHWLQSVYVHPLFRQQGVFRALYRAALTDAQHRGAAGLRLYVDRRNERASEVYRRLGMNGDHYRVFEAMFDTEEPA